MEDLGSILGPSIGAMKAFNLTRKYNQNSDDSLLFFKKVMNIN